MLWKINDSAAMERNISEIRKYLDQKFDSLKLQTVDGLSVVVSRILTMMAMLMVGAIVLAAFAFGAMVLLGKLIGDLAAAAFMTGSVFLVALALIYVFRKKLFQNMFVRLFIGIFYGSE